MDAAVPDRALRWTARVGIVVAAALCGTLLALVTSPGPLRAVQRQTQPPMDVTPTVARRPVGVAPVSQTPSKAVQGGLLASALALASLTGDSLAAPAATSVFGNRPPAQPGQMQQDQLAELAKYLAPEVAKDAPTLAAGENYNPLFDADYEPQDSFENILGLVVKLLVFAPIMAFLGFFLYGFVSNSEETKREDRELAEQQRRMRAAARVQPVEDAVPPVTRVETPIAVVAEQPIVSLDDVAAADSEKEHVALYFRPIPEGVGFAEMRRLFRTFGDVECLSLKEDHGFVWMNEKAATTAIAVLHGGEFRNTRMVVRMADTNNLPAAQRQVILRQCQIQSEKMEKVENRSIHYFRCLAATAAKAAKNIDHTDLPPGEEKSKYQRALENMSSTLEDIANHHVVDSVDAHSTAQQGLEELVKLAQALKAATSDTDRQVAAGRILDCVTKYADMEVIPHHTKPKDGTETMALYFRPVPKGIEPSVYADLFNRYGNVEAIQLKEKYGFVWMEEAGAKAALELLQGYRVPGGRLFVSVAKTNALSKSDKSKAVRPAPGAAAAAKGKGGAKPTERVAATAARGVEEP